MADIYGTPNDDLLNGTTANDYMVGYGGNDTMNGGDGNDFVFGDIGDDVLDGGTGDDTIFGQASNDLTVQNDQLRGGQGNDVLDGGAGSDKYYFNLGDGVDAIQDLVRPGEINTIQFGPGISLADITLSQSAGSLVLSVGSSGDAIQLRGYSPSNPAASLIIQKLAFADGSQVDLLPMAMALTDFYGTPNNDWIDGTPGNNFIDARGGNDRVAGGLGNDHILGGDGSDTLYGGDTTSLLGPGSDGNDLIEGGEGDDSIYGESGSDISYGGNGRDYIADGYGDDQLYGETGDDSLSAGAGNDRLDGGAGVDWMFGGLGDDTFVVDNVGDTVAENIGEGTDTVLSSIDYTAAQSIERVTLQGNAIFAIGNVENNTLTGNAQANYLDGGLGADVMAGGLGDDHYIVDQAGDVVNEAVNQGSDWVESSINYVLPDNVERLDLKGVSTISGTGNGLDNFISGNTNGGANVLAGGRGNDFYVAGSGDTVVEFANEGIDEVQSDFSFTLGAHVENLSLTVSPFNTAIGTGNDLDNRLSAFFSNGSVTFAGGLGNDLYIVGQGGTTIVEAVDAGIDTVQSHRTFTLGANLEILTLTGTAVANGTGNVLANTITGNSAANTLTGGDGDDIIHGGDGNDTLDGGNGNDQLFGEGGTDELLGGDGNDLLDGGVGSDSMSGGIGDDTYVIDSFSDVVTEAAGEGIDTVQSNLSMVELGAHLENATLTGTGYQSAIGNDLNNMLIGTNAINGLDGRGGDDTMIGGGGNDQYNVDSSNDVIIELVGEGTDMVLSTASYTLSANVENILLLDTASINATGNDLANGIWGNDGANVLDGGLGVDSMFGGLGDDTYIVETLGDMASEAPGGGTDTIISSFDNYIPFEVENLLLVGQAVVGSGNDLDNVMTGNAWDNMLAGGFGNDTLIGGAGDDQLNGEWGADTMVGGTGDDIYQIDDANDVVMELNGEGIDTVEAGSDHTLGANVENLTLGFGVAGPAVSGTGNALDNVITGNFSNNVLAGGDGDDVLRGNDGEDTLDGGNGNDQLFGEGGNDNLFGSLGDDLLDGGVGSDSMTGGEGNDTYVVDNGTDVVIETEFEGVDTVESSVSYTLGLNVEQLTLTGFDTMNGTGNELDNILRGNSGVNILDGGSGNDTLNGLAGNDWLIGGVGADRLDGGDGDDLLYIDGTDTLVQGGAGIDSVYVQSGIAGQLGVVLNLGQAGIENAFGGDGNDTLTTSGAGDVWITGNAGDDTLSGGVGADSLVGGDGNDVVSGGAGNDSLVGNAGADSLSGGDGDDLLWIDSRDIVVQGGLGSDTVRVETGSPGVTLDLGLAEVEIAEGGTGNDTFLSSGSVRVVVYGGEGNDAIQGGAGDDFLTGDWGSSGNGNDLLDGGDGADLLNGGDGLDTLYGGLGNDYLNGDAGNDIEYGGLGVDVIGGQDGEDALYGEEGDDFLIGGNGTDYLNGGAGNDWLYGDLLFGNNPPGNDVLIGGVGADLMRGGVGDDRYEIDDIGDTVLELTNQGTDTVEAWITYTLGADVENLTLMGFPAINGTGNSLDNVLTGNSEANVLDGGIGADTMAGEVGNDTYIVDNMGDTVVEELNDGIDMVESSVMYTLVNHVENLTLTGASAINGTGNGLDNVLMGNSAANILMGGAGNDTYLVGAGDTVVEGTNEGIDLVQSDGSFVLSDNVESLTLTGTSAVNGTGNAFNNVLTGNSASNVLDGGVGADALWGGAGDDTYLVDNINDIVVEHLNDGIDTIQSSVTYTVGANVEDLTLMGTTAINGTGNSLNNVLTGNSAANMLDGGTGIDTLVGGQGDDTYILDSLFDVVTELAGEGTDTIQRSFDIGNTLEANVENLTLTGTTAIMANGNSLNNVLRGNSVTNIIDGQSGADMMIGGDGNDTYLVDDINDVVVENAGEGLRDSVLSSLSYTLGANVEELQLQGMAAIDGTGNMLNNVLTGNSAANVLNGAAGVDFMLGGAGDDTYVVDNVDDAVAENLNEGSDTVQASVTYTLGANIENLTLTGTSAINGIGNMLNNILTGNSAENVLDGDSGADTMLGGQGDDTYLVENIADVVMENLNEGIDTVQSTITYMLGGNVENLMLAGTAVINATGNGLNNTLTGNSSANVLDGGAGGDVMFGAAGNDIYVVDNVSDVVTENVNEGTDTVQSSITYTLGANIENLTLTGTGVVNGSGNSLNNTLLGNVVANILDGGAGADTMTGGQGDDTYIIDTAGDTVTEAVNEGLDTVQSGISYTLGANVENLTLTGATAINGTGNALNNILIGNSAANTLAGGAGNDTYVVGTGDAVVEAANAGIDTVQSALTYTLGSNLENLTLTGTAAINGTGNSLNNVLTGNSAANTLTGGAGNDTYVVGAGDTVVELNNGGTDTVQSSVTWTLGSNLENLTLIGTSAINGTGNGSDNVLVGNSAVNTLSGSSGNDTLAGGQGNDILNGGTGNDIFQFFRGDGQDLVQDNSGSADKMQFGTMINPLDLVISRQANDLRLSIHGSTDQVTIQNWYTSSSNRTETIQAGNGKMLLSTQVDQLIQAMASFSQQSGLTWDQAIDQQPTQVQSILAASWQ